jgi:hypothetical protein
MRELPYMLASVTGAAIGLSCIGPAIGVSAAIGQGAFMFVVVLAALQYGGITTLDGDAAKEGRTLGESARESITQAKSSITSTVKKLTSMFSKAKMEENELPVSRLETAGSLPIPEPKKISSTSTAFKNASDTTDCDTTKHG